MGLAGLLFLYKGHYPSGRFFPQCPTLVLFGCQCPGCGSQRAVHHLLNGRWWTAFMHNQLLVLSIPYLVMGFLLEKSGNKRWQPLRKKLMGPTAIWVIFTIVILFWVLRNMPWWPRP